MAEINYKEIVNNCLSEVIHDQIAVSCSVDARDRGGISSVLGCQAECKVFAVEAMKGEALISGKVCYKVIYLDDDGRVQGLDYFCDYNEKLSSDSVEAEMKLNAYPSVVELTSTVNDGELTLTAVCDFVVRAITTREFKSLTDMEGGFLKTELSECVRLNQIKENVAELIGEEESGYNVEKVLLYETKALVEEVVKGEGVSVVKGIVNVETVLSTTDGIRGKSVSLPFSEEIECDGDLEVRVSVKSSRLVLSGDENNSVLEFKVFLSISGYEVNVEEETLATDVFSLDNDLRYQVDYLPCKRFIGMVSRETPISGELDVGVSGRILASPVSRVNVARVKPIGNGAMVEGIVSAVVYYENDGVKGVEVELPFSINLDCDVADYITAEGIANGLTCGFSMDRLRITANVVFTLYLYKSFRLKWISNVEVGGEKERNQAGLSIFFADASDSLWDVAKAVNVSPDELLALNPDFNEVQEGCVRRRVTVFRRKD